MTIAGGTRLGPYEIVSLLGARGMGQVYRARDTRLDRSVAIKVLAPALAGDAEFRDRFEFERPFTNLATSSDRGYDMMPYGRRFLSVTDPLLAEGTLRWLTVVLNWFEELKARVPAGK